MPTSESAKKRLRQSEKRRLATRIARKVIRTFSKKAVAEAAEGKLEQAESAYRTAVAKLDKAGLRRILHPNTADRRKSRLTREYQAAVLTAKAKA